jgi:hypothetical protein
MLDIVNPLQHIPLVNLVYREITGDAIRTPAALAGGALFGGPLGFAGAVATAAFEDVTGDTPAGHVLALLKDEGAARAASAYARVAALAETENRR